ncbi:MAG: 30S ribosomal protein S12 methylthiotransferase RimO, partial [Firmicutes bacterium]|nr:30S ribosomal protein S12 methylthiotransferase RimO [Bacillota bacterium]
MRIYIETMGCPKNIVDSETAAGLLESKGHEIVAAPEDAEAILVNTCGFINDAKTESINRIFDLSAYKEENGAILMVSGCLSQRYGTQFAEAMPEADIIVGVNDYDRLPEILEQYQKDTQVCTGRKEDEDYVEIGPRKRMGTSYSAYLKIAEGCDNVCTYCIIPYIRGHYRSRSEEEILKEAKQLAAEGVKELILVAQDVTAYGMDFDGEYHLAGLLKKLCRIDGIRWIRLLYCYEDRITDELIETIASEEKICKYIDIPIQHASDKVLKEMNRRSTQASTEATLKKLRAAVPGICIRTTLIAGFPGEKKADYFILRNFVRDMKFDRLGVFAYSKEEGTVAGRRKDQVRRDVKEARRDRIMALQREISLAHNEELVGRTIEVLVEEEDTPGVYLGRSQWDAPEIDNSVIFTADRELQPGEFVQVVITDA